MNVADYIAKARTHADKLRSLLGNHHPRSAAYARASREMPITAPNAQTACNAVVAHIQRTTPPGAPHPIAVFNIALEVANLEAAQGIDRLLNEAWFGVPESTACWHITGFKEAVAMMEDPPSETD